MLTEGVPEGATVRMVTKRFRQRITPELRALMQDSPAVAKQFVPDVRELISFPGETDEPFEEGRGTAGVYGLERLYADRAVVTPYFDCSSFCRYCFKKTRTLAGDRQRMSGEDVAQALDYIAADPRLRTVLITGGDPLLDLDLLGMILEGAAEISHVRNVRIGTRNLLFQPDRLTEDVAEWLAGYHRVDPDHPLRSKSLVVAFSLNHPDELTPAVIRAIQRLTSRGIQVRGQVTLLRDINDDVATMTALYDLFECVGVASYYLYHCMPVVGAAHFRTSVQRGLDILRQMAPLTGAFCPTYVYVTRVGKHRIAPGHQLEYVELDGRRHIRAVSPYLAEDFFAFTGKSELPPLHEVGPGGYIVSHYLDADDDVVDVDLTAAR